MAVTGWVGFLFLYGICCICVTEGARLNVPKVLLPYWSLEVTNFTIQLHEQSGCFVWESSRPEIASVHPLNDDPNCSHMARVSAMSQSPQRLTAVVLARNTQTGEVLRCDIIVDSIKSIDIETTTRVLYLEDSPEKFVVKAQDSEGNTFSSLEGVPFEWSLLSNTETSSGKVVNAQHLLRIQSFRESAYETPADIEQLEERGLQGYMILVEGVRSGSAIVQAKLRDPVYKSVGASTVPLIVIANILLSPPDVYILQLSTVTYQVQLLQQGSVSDVEMPNRQYSLEVANDEVCVLETQTSTVTGLELGSTNVQLKDRNIDPKLLEAFLPPYATVNVVLGSYLGFVVLPGRRWVLESDREYEVHVELYDQHSHKMHISDNLRIQTNFITQYFDVLSSSDNGSYFVVQTRREGHTNIDASLAALLRHDESLHEISPVITGFQEVEIYAPIRVTPSQLIFPWQPKPVKYSHKLRAVGGSGEYTWSSSKPDIGTVMVKESVATLNKIGSTVITATDIKNPLHTDWMTVNVIPPVELSFNPGPVEAMIGRTLVIPLSMYGMIDGERIEFTDCRQVTLEVSVGGSDEFTVVPPSTTGGDLPTDGCTSVTLKAESVGHTKLTVLYHGSDDTILKDTLTVAAYSPLKPVNPERVTILSLGSSRQLHFEGGPHPWILDQSKYYETAYPSEYEKALLPMLPSSRNRHRFLIECSALSESTVISTVGNGPTLKNKQPAMSTASVSVACVEPADVSLTPEPLPASAPGLAPCPVNAQSGEAVPSSTTAVRKILVRVSDSLGRYFDNITTLQFVCSSLDTELATLGAGGQLVHEATGDSQGHLLMEPTGKEGNLTIQCTVGGSSRLGGAQQQQPLLQKSLQVALVKPRELTPRSLSVFTHPSTRASLAVSGGSGFFHVEHDGKGRATVVYDGGNRKVWIQPTGEGPVTVNVHDLCLGGEPGPAQAILHLSGGNRIEFKVRDKVELGRSILAEVRVLDRTGVPLSASHFHLMNLAAVLQTDHITVVSSLEPRLEPVGGHGTTVLYNVSGESLGTARLMFTAAVEGGEKIKSRSADIQVFPPLRIDPRDVVLIIGTQLQMTASGGPQPQTAIEFSVDHEPFASISAGGVTNGLSTGSTRIHARAIGTDEDTGEGFIYSRDSTTLTVTSLKGIRVYAPLARLRAGAHMPAYVMGLGEGENPFSFANVHPPLSFHWSSSNRAVVGLSRPMEAQCTGKEGVGEECEMGRGGVEGEGEGFVRVHAMREGQAGVSVTVRGNHPQLVNGITVRDELQIKVFDELTLTLPQTCAGQLTITPQTTTQVTTNRDSAAKRMVYQIQGGSSSLATITPQGQLRTFAQVGEVSLSVSALEDFGLNQTAVILVKIKPVSYLMLTLLTPLHLTPGSKPLSSVPVGSTLLFTVTFHDDVGQAFFATDSKLKFRPNRYDMVQLSTSQEKEDSLVIHTSKLSHHFWGGSIIKVWDEKNPSLVDYVNINAQNLITGSQTEHVVGDVLCLFCPLVTQQGYIGQWFSASEALVVDERTGVAQSMKPGRTKISYKLSSQLSTHLEIDILQMTNVQITSSDPTSMVTLMSELKLPVTINGRPSVSCGGSAASSPVQLLKAAPFSCKAYFVEDVPDVSLETLFNVEAAFSYPTGYYCGLSPVMKTLVNQSEAGDLDSLLAKVSGLRSDVVVEVFTEDHSSTVEVPFRPDFWVLSKKVEVDVRTGEGVVSVSTTIPHTDFDVRVNDELVLSIGSVSVAPGGVTFKVSLTASARALNPVELLSQSGSLQLDIMDSMTHFSQTLPVKLKFPSETDAFSGSRVTPMSWAAVIGTMLRNYDLILFLILAFLMTLLCAIVGYHYIFNGKAKPAPKPKRNNDSIFLKPGSSPSSNSSFSQAPLSPGRSPSMSPTRVSLWSAGYDPQDSSAGDYSLFRRTPPHQRLSPMH